MLFKGDFLKCFATTRKAKSYCEAFPQFIFNNSENYLFQILEDFEEEIRLKSNYIIVITSILNESGVGKSNVGIFIIEKMLEIYPDFNFVLINNFSDFLSKNNITKRTIYLIDDATFSEIGLGSQRIKKQFAEFTVISARKNQVCFIFTTTFEIQKFAFLKNIKNHITVLGFNEILNKSFSTTYNLFLREKYFIFTDLASIQMIEKYEKMKVDYTSSFLDKSQKSHLELILDDIDLNDYKNMNRSETLSKILIKFSFLGKGECEHLRNLIFLKRENKL